MQANILFSNNDQVNSNDSLKHLLQHQSKSYIVTIVDNQLFVVIKDEVAKKQTLDAVRMLAGDIGRDLSKQKVDEAVIHAQDLVTSFADLAEEDLVTAFVEGWHLGSYEYRTYKSNDHVFVTNLTVESDRDLEQAVVAGKIRAEAMNFSRDLMNEAPNELNPETFPERLVTAFANTDVKVTVYDQQELEAMEMNGVLAVGRGSKYAPAFVEISYCTDDSKPLVALVGKGVTFDTGGISLKGSRDLSDMRMDMGGAAAVAGAMQLLVKSKANVNVVALMPIVENMPDNKSILPGDVIRYKNGLNVQIGNTDAEGRLILADALIRADELKADYVVDIATLTGAIHRALGSKLAGVFGDDELAKLMKEIGDQNGDFNWPMPLVDDYESYLSSDYADFSNISNKSEAGAITAALFLRRFVSDQSKWLHVDMAGVMESGEKGYYTKSATGYGARLLADFATKISK